jgi:hypothetical protein
LLSLFLLGTVLGLCPQTIVAQDAGAVAPNNAPAQAAPGQDDDVPAQKITMLSWLFKALGWLYTIVFLVISSFVAFRHVNVLSARQQQIVRQR